MLENEVEVHEVIPQEIYKVATKASTKASDDWIFDGIEFHKWILVASIVSKPIKNPFIQKIVCHK